MAHDNAATARYQSSLEALDRDLHRLQLRSQRLGWIRVALSLPGMLLILADLLEPRVPNGVWILGTLLLVAFLAAATVHEWVRDRIEHTIRQRAFYRRLRARCERRWSDLPATPCESTANAFASELSRDVDLFGERSLFRLLSLAVTDSGAECLARWLTEWVPTTDIERRQSAVRELVAQPAWRQAWWDAVLGFRGLDSTPERIAAWGSEPPLFQGRPAIVAATKVGPACAILGLVAILFGMATAQPWLFNAGWIVGLIGLVLNLLLTITIVGRIHDVFVGIGSAHRELQSLYRMMQLIEELTPESPLLQAIRSSIASPEASATTAIERLRRRMGLAGIQRNPLFFLVYWVLQLFVLWDVRVLESLERWKVRFGTHIATWVSALGQFEALISAATLADENPDWAYPVWKDDRTRNLSVAQLGHPLLAPSARVCNDLRIEESHPLLLVTGSNMAGKSTLLRSLGINTLLARSGSPVCCKQWIGPNAELASSIRVQDSLQDGVSFFMAELKRLRTIVDFTQSSLARSPRGCIVLLDEILQGTNSRERQIAVESVLQQLVQLQALVLASTHDLELANVPSLTSIAQIVHFREYFESVDGTEKMKFDYTMRPGVTPTTNALKLLELVGLASRR